MKNKTIIEKPEKLNQIQLQPDTRNKRLEQAKKALSKMTSGEGKYIAIINGAKFTFQNNKRRLNYIEKHKELYKPISINIKIKLIDL